MASESPAIPTDLPAVHLPSVAVLIPAFNEERTIQRAVESALLLDYPADKVTVIAVDDGSKDGTGTILERIASNEKRLWFVRQANAGRGRALNRALAECHSDLALALDADTFVDANYLKVLAPRFISPEVGAAIGADYAADEDTWVSRSNGAYLRALHGGLVLGRRAPVGTGLLCRVNLLVALGGFDQTRVSGTLATVQKIEAEGKRVTYDPRARMHVEVESRLAGCVRQRLRWRQEFASRKSNGRSPPLPAVLWVGGLSLVSLGSFCLVLAGILVGLGWATIFGVLGLAAVEVAEIARVTPALLHAQRDDRGRRDFLPLLSNCQLNLLVRLILPVHWVLTRRDLKTGGRSFGPMPGSQR